MSIRSEADVYKGVAEAAERRIRSALESQSEAVEHIGEGEYRAAYRAAEKALSKSLECESILRTAIDSAVIRSLSNAYDSEMVEQIVRITEKHRKACDAIAEMAGIFSELASCLCRD